MEIEFSLDDIFEYFRQKGGKVIYTELVTHFKHALSNPQTQANARVVFKNYVNTLANVHHENEKKYLILRTKFMKMLYETPPHQQQQQQQQPSLKQLNTTILSADNSPNISCLSNGSYNNHQHVEHHNSDHHRNVNNSIMTSPTMNSSIITENKNSSLGNTSIQQNSNNGTPTATAMMMTTTTMNNIVNDNAIAIDTITNHKNNSTMRIPPPNNLKIIHSPSSFQYNNMYFHQKSPLKSPSVLPTINEINYNNNNNNNNNNNSNSSNSSSSQSISMLNEDEFIQHQQQLDSQQQQLPPPRPPPRKKNSFNSKTLKPNATVSREYKDEKQLPEQRQPPPNDIEQFESINAVKKEIQELTKVPGRVKEHAQILNKLALNTKLPMPTTPNSVSQVVNNKVRNTAHSDTDSGSVHLTDPLKKRWIIASSNCDFPEMLSLLKQDPELCRYCDSIMGYSALHWAAKFNKPEIIKLIAGNHKVDPNIKSYSGSTPLHIAAQFKHEEIMKMLVYHYGANREIRDNYGKKPYQYLQKKNDDLQLNQSTANHSAENGNNNVSPSLAGSQQNSMSAKDNLKNNLRNKISHQSMLVRNTLRNTKAFKRRKSMNEKSKEKNKNQNLT